jgi:hypothetical protein
MSRSSLKFLAVVLSLLIVIVLFAGLDNLPRTVRAQIDSERAALASAQKQLASEKDQVARQMQAEPALFGAIASSRAWPAEFDKDQAALQSAARDMDELSRLEKQNRRQDRARAESLLGEERNLRASAAAGGGAIAQESAHWIDRKQHLPAELADMDRDYHAVTALDLTPVAAAVQKAETDWPAKKADLDARLAAVRTLQQQSDTAWQSSADARREAAASDYAHLNFGALFSAADTLKTDAAQAPQKTAELQALTGQLYTSWDKLLVDMETRGIGTDKSYDQKIRTVATRLADAQAKTGETTSDEKWVVVSKPVYDAERNDLGMAIEHKPAGEYDFEAERVPQPAGFAYMAPPSQERNQYGYWDHGGGHSFWVFYGQYALMRDLLFNHDYRPLDRNEWDGYYGSRRSGQTYYGRDEAHGAPKYGTAGSTTQDRYSGSTFAKSGGFRSSEYASHSGSYGGSKYATPSSKLPEGERGARTFGSHGAEPRMAPRPSAPRPSFRMPRTGRSFGRHR